MSEAITLSSTVNAQAVLTAPGPPLRHSVSDEWDVLGPFPIHAREQHFLSPSYPLDLSKEIDYAERWASSYADNGEVGWTNATSANGTLAVSFPDIRWDSLRATEGWAALQHHTVLRTSITIYPPTMQDRAQISHLLIDIKQGSFFTVLPSWQSNAAERRSAVPKWYASNIYSMSAAPPQAVPFPVAPSLHEPTTYDLFVSGDYEIRLFGDPKHRDTEVPELLVDFSVDLLYLSSSELGLRKSHDVIPDFVDGWAFGQHIGIGLYSTNDWWNINSVSLWQPVPGNAIEIRLLQETRLAPTQTRVVPILLTQKAAFTGPQIDVMLRATSGSRSYSIPVKIEFKHTALWDATPYKPIVASYMYGTSTPTAFIVAPPKERSQETQPPILSLHGAGVEIIRQFQQFAPPRHETSWTIAPTGRTAWGLDWHGPSTQDAWATVEALSGILSRNPQWSPWGFAPDTSVVVVGHSNGGQGTWHIISRYPDRVISAVPAAAYVKSQAYVPLVQSRSAHFIDPALRAILETSLTPDDNDLFLSNLANMPLFVVHGGADENVPVWHSRALVDGLKTWNPDANITFREDPGQPHWYPGIFNNTPVQEFINRTIKDFHENTAEPVLKFTLTVAVPSESGPLHGWRIESLRVPGRLARMTVEIRDNTIFVEARNTHMFSVSRSPRNPFFEGILDALVIDGQRLAFPAHESRTTADTVFFARKDDTWEYHTHSLQAGRVQVWGRMSLILNSRAPILFVIPDKYDAGSLLAALRLAHSLDVYHKLAADIIEASQATDMLLQGALLPEQNIVVIGGPQNAFAKHCLAHSTTRFHIRDDTLYLRDRPLAATSSALFLSPHPTSATAITLFISANDEAGLERALRLFPIRTGVTVPDWVVLSPGTDAKGAGGVDAAGVWGVNWSWNEGMSSF